jgi:hypothetical protein
MQSSLNSASVHDHFGLMRVASALFALLCGLCICRGLRAAPIVIANRTEAPVRFVWSERPSVAPDLPVIASHTDLGDSKSADSGAKNQNSAALKSAPPSIERNKIEPGDIAVIHIEPTGRALIRWDGAESHQVEPFSAYYFGTAASAEIELRQIGLGDVQNPQSAATFARDRFERQRRELIGAPNADQEQRRTIRVALYVDDEEAAAKAVCQKRLRDRITAASEIIERSCGMKLEVASYRQWQSTDGITDFHRTLREFERTAQLRDARLAIGFTSQYQLTRGRTHLGGTRGPLASHILLREWSNHVSEPERLELLVHELSHFLGAAHSPESISVMRPVLGDRQARLKRFTIAVDPINALVMNLVADEIRDRGVTSFAQISDMTSARLRVIYQVLAEAVPDDPAAKDYLNFLDRRAALRRAMSPIAP